MVTWNRLSLSNKANGFRVLWTLEGEFEEELMMGLVLACWILIKEYNKFDESNEFDLGIIVGSHEFEDLYELDDIVDFPSFADIDILREDVVRNIRPIGNNLLLLVTAVENLNGQSGWILIELKRIDLFLQGFITMCNAFQVDFRDYILQLPIDTDDIKYDIINY